VSGVGDPPHGRQSRHASAATAAPGQKGSAERHGGSGAHQQRRRRPRKRDHAQRGAQRPSSILARLVTPLLLLDQGEAGDQDRREGQEQAARPLVNQSDQADQHRGDGSGDKAQADFARCHLAQLVQSNSRPGLRPSGVMWPRPAV